MEGDNEATVVYAGEHKPQLTNRDESNQLTGYDVCVVLALGYCRSLKSFRFGKEGGGFGIVGEHKARCMETP